MIELDSKFYNFSANSLQKKEIAMEAFKGKTLLIVNTASKCGFTPQYAGLQSLYEKYQDQGFIVLGFPCNQFGNQEPGDENSIAENCLVNYGVTFPMFSKIKVNGKETHPIFKYLKKKLPGTFGKTIKWNFTKFLIDGDGNPVKRFAPTTKPEELEKDIREVLHEDVSYSNPTS